MIGGAVAFGAGGLYAVVLWMIADAAARRRNVHLGSLPWWLAVLAGTAAAVLHVVLAAADMPPLAAGLLGAFVAGVVDARTGYIFDALTVAVALSAAAAAAADGRLAAGAAAAACVGAGLAAVYIATRRRGIGLGDVKLGSALAVGFGPAVGTVAIGSAFVLGAGYALILIASGRAQRTDALRFGPFIAGGAVTSLAADALRWFA
jgi:leader peptidase (prepilin peptidase)/N-methyltransferase